jgi:intracellular septation protein
MKLLFDAFPILLFFAAFKFAGIFVATAVAIAASLAQIAWMRLRGARIEPMQWISLGVIVVFGGATLISHNDTFIRWKPTVLYWIMGGALLVGQLVFRRNLLKALMGTQMELPDAAWRVMNWSWIAFFALMGVLNLWVAFNFDLNTLVDFKLFGGIGLMVVFVVVQALFLGRYLRTDETGDS